MKAWYEPNYPENQNIVQVAHQTEKVKNTTRLPVNMF